MSASTRANFPAAWFPWLLIVCLTAGCGSSPTDKPYSIDVKYGVDDPQFARTMGSLLGPPIVGGNSTSTLVNGDRIFPAMLEAVRSARKTINFETFIYWSGTVGKEFSDALAERAAKGVKVHLIIDSIGSGNIDRKHVARMKEAGVKIVSYHPLQWYNLTSAQKLNNRTHRKLLIVDGTVGFTGGAGIADYWLGNADSPKHWRDTHYMLRGPAVAHLQAAFLDNWMEATGKV